MNKKLKRKTWLVMGLGMLFLLFGVIPAQAKIDGLTGNTFNLTAKADYISTADGWTYLIWGYADGAGRAQYPGPTLIVSQGDMVTVNLTNQLAAPVSIVFPGQQGVTATGGSAGVLTNEAASGGTVSYTFVASQPGTYTYYSGTNPDLQVEMGLVGVVIVRPYGYVQGDMMTYRAYNDMDSQYEREFLFFLSEMDPNIHQDVEFGLTADTTAFWPVYWFINGRTAPDTMSAPNVAWLPTQPYNSMPATRPGEKVLLRIVGGGRDLHPYHTHGNHVRVIAKDGRLLSSAPGSGANLSRMEFTVTSAPGQTVDAIFTWTGEKMGWDIYGHAPGDPLAPGEDPSDHGKPFPVVLPEQQNLTFGGWYSGSPFLGAAGTLPPGEGGLNPNAGFFFMWHSHNENEIVNYNIFPGGMLTMTVVEPPWVDIME
jgi:FtsP/CotA-like multicopper oxidase with cupredoxin domain